MNLFHSDLFTNFLKLTPGSTDFSVGKTDSQIEINILNKKIIFEPSICYEAIFQTSHKKESQFLINITNDGWFGKPLVLNNTSLLKYLEQSKNQTLN